MAFPLVVNPVTASNGVDAILPLETPIRLLEISATRVTDFKFIQNNFIRQNLTVHVDAILPLPNLVFPLEITVSRTWWAGLGGTNYIPSFPQLDRQATTFPHAF